ncbi:MAG TPA: hypothetical protein VGN07_18005 [Steroidobacteraceae bacterium]
MKLALGLKLFSATVICSVAFAAHADMMWDEANNGDLSNDGLSPTPLAFTAGSNSIIGTAGDNGDGIVDRDYFTFTVPTGMRLTSIKLLDNTSVAGGASFIGLQAGPQMTVSPEGVGAENLLGYMHYSNDDIGTNLLPTIAPLLNSLPGGTYSAWVQEVDGLATYGFEFGVTPAAPVPLPGAAILLLSGLAGLAPLRGRKKKAA